MDASSTGATFIEPTAVSKLREELGLLETAEENEEKIILYTLSALVGDNLDAVSVNLEYMEELDFIFAKGKLSADMKARQPSLNTRRFIRIVNGRHPLLTSENPVPLNVEFGGKDPGRHNYRAQYRRKNSGTENGGTALRHGLLRTSYTL